MITVALTNIQSKIKIYDLLSDPNTLMRRVRQGSMLSYIIEAEILVNFIVRIKGIQIGDAEIKTVNFADENVVFLRDVTYLDRI